MRLAIQMILPSLCRYFSRFDVNRGNIDFRFLWICHRVVKIPVFLFISLCVGTRLPAAEKSLKMTETLKLRGTLCGHNGWVTQIATNPKYPDMILSSSRGK